MALRVMGVVLVSAGVSYVHVMSRLEAQTQTQLEKYISARGERESSIFQLAQDNLAWLHHRLLLEFKQPTNIDFQAEFERQYFSWNDGTRRNFPQNRPSKDFDSTRYAGLFIGRNVQITEELQQRLFTANTLITAYGAAWSNRFVDTYFVTPENASVCYWKGMSFALETPPDLYHPKENISILPILGITRLDRRVGQVFILIQVLRSGWFRQLYLSMRAIASWALWDMMWS